MGFLETNDLAHAPSFRARVTTSLVKVAGSVLEEPQGEKSLTHYNKRLSLARDVFSDPAKKVDSFIWPVLSNPTVAAEGLDTNDSSIEYQVSEVWDLLAGVSAQDKVVATEPEPEE